MSLHERSRGASVVEYALLLFLFIGGAAVAMKSTGFAVRDVIDGAAAGELAGLGDSRDVRLGAPPERRDGGR